MLVSFELVVLTGCSETPCVTGFCAFPQAFLSGGCERVRLWGRWLVGPHLTGDVCRRCDGEGARKTIPSID